MSELKPCPFCGDNEVKIIVETGVHLHDMYKPFCDECGAGMCWESDKRMAELRWNDRCCGVDNLKNAIIDIKKAYDWYNVDTYDRCQSVVDDAIDCAVKLAEPPK